MKLVEFCASVPWLIKSDNRVRPDVRDVLLRDIRPYELAWSAAPPATKLWLNGERLASSPASFRVLPSARLAITADCGSAKRTHWLAADHTPLELHIDCALDQAVHTDDRGLWLSSSASLVTAHAQEVATVVGAKRIIVVSQRSGDLYSLQLQPAGSAAGAVVALAVVHGDRQLQAAVDHLLVEDAGGGAMAEPRTSAEPSSSAEPIRWTLWSGVAALGVGVAGTAVAGWLYAERKQDLERFRSQVDAVSISAKDLWGNSRVQMLGAVLGGAAFAGAGAVLLTRSLQKEPPRWWIAAGIGAAGLGVAAWGAAELGKGELCDEPLGCGRAQLRRDRGVLLLGVAAPLLTVPLTELLIVETKRLRKSRVDVGVTAEGLRVSGSW